MNLFDSIKNAFSNEDEKAAAEKAAAEQAAAEQAAQEAAAVEQAAQEAAAAEEEAKTQAEAAERVAAQERALQEAAAAEQAAAEQAAAEAAAAEQAAAAAAAKPVISLNGLIAMVNHDSSDAVATGQGLNLQAGLVVEQALASVVGDTGPVDGSLGTSFTAAYARWQQSLGYSGADADGIPGRESLQALAERTGAFTVTD